MVSAPALKHHFQAVVTLSLKNMKGCLPDDEKRLCHAVGLEQAIADYCALMRPALSVVYAWATRDRIKDVSYDVGLVLAGCDPVAVDAVGARLMGFDPAGIAHLRFASAAGEISARWGGVLDELTAVMGRARPPRGCAEVLAVGDCCSGLGESVPHARGCPPARSEIIRVAGALARRLEKRSPGLTCDPADTKR